ncbi:cell division protein FtsN [Heyndrickxia shackletonii]|uniref:Cell division protein FtsN n=1 Tax=Heyndrickxia shackletonii TaxID=157838 RepID=A0A0Q3TL89_9BACI|nr:TasA family protein [Heyndrickxia shackletonii]KQL54425.1 cell division protein FtsN [Heyndrickxia shackletonii]NEY99146.1 cell division protein FtsN [Heyndrickxia shackletonii]
MSLTKKVTKGFITAALGFSLIGGGTYAYFSDTEATNNTFAAGTLDLSVNPSTVVNVNNIKPGDEIKREFQLTNNGSLAISKVLLNTDYKVDDAKLNGKENTEDMAKHIKVTILYNQNNASTPVIETTLYDLKNQTPDLTQIDTLSGPKADGLAPGEKNKMIVLFEFKDKGQDQNQFQGDALQVEWKFNAEQASGSLNEG